MIFCTDDFLITLNKKYLNHDYYTDILTFNLSNIHRVINAEIYISIERVKYNSALFNFLFINELYRVMIHGILHLCGYNDKSKSGKIRMTQKENFYLSLIDDCFT